MVDLDVDLYGDRVGTLVEQRDGFDFVVAPEAITRWGIGSSILSCAVPLVAVARPEDAPLRRNFFDEALPEGRARTRLAGNARISPDYTIGMLARYGGDFAGALRIWNPDLTGVSRTPEFRPIDARGIRRLLEEVTSSPLGNTDIRKMSSLAGIQDKIVLARRGQQWGEALDGLPSTHILKPVHTTHPTIIFDEEYGARVIRSLGLAKFQTSLEVLDGATALVIERYDRDASAPDGRVHQEDFSQILGLTGNGKYEEFGGVGLAAIARVLRDHVGRVGVEALLRLTTASVAIGNLDMHAKNISLLHLPDGSARLAPAYDVVPQMHQPFDKKFAFAINGAIEHSDITCADLIAEGRRWGLRNSDALVDTTIRDVAEFVGGSRPTAGAHFGLQQDILQFCRNLSSGLGASSGGSGGPAATVAPGGWGGPVR